MSLTKQDFSQYIRDFNFRELFNEMGWNNDKTIQPITVDMETFALQAVAEKSGFKILVCSPTSDGIIPDSKTRKKIETKVTKLFQEHLIIFHNASKTEQIWQFVVRQTGKPTKTTETRYNTDQDPELLFQRTAGIFFELDEEDQITIVDVTKRVEENFHKNAEAVVKRFYTDFSKQHKSFYEFVAGIDDHIDVLNAQQKKKSDKKDNKNKQWYVSLMLNRLMFCYFIQKQRFLDNNQDYLRDKLNECREKHGDDEFYSFYRDFLLYLFHDGLGSPEDDDEIKAELGKIPYLNGGLFDVHELEQTFKDIKIEDDAFERIFDFFDDWTWHLDTRREAKGKDINPDVIGYIFEKYINDRAQMGAYYTKEDITDYISKNCILPFLFEETKRNYAKGFSDDSEIWQMLKSSGDTYIYDAVKQGVNEVLPDDIRIGLDTDEPNLLERRKDWNKSAPETHALPTEIWREVVDRRNRYFDIRDKIESGKIKDINDFITYNLNITQFAQDIIENTDDPKFLQTFYKALNSVTIIDPTCGSGAFLFAAMNILESLYESCLQRMRNFIEDEDKLNTDDQNTFNNKFSYFRDVLQDVQGEAHPNTQYFIYKSIILHNLYGVDIMKEAVEIAKLRLFLKLVATVEADQDKPNLGLEPLPDIDFNIRSGNTLIGYVSKDQIDNLAALLVSDEDKKKLLEECDVVARTFKRFKEIQLSQANDFTGLKLAKNELNVRLEKLNKSLNKTLFKEHYEGMNYGVWNETHEPFHWFAEFYEIIHEKGGFDVIIGNPPYVENRNIEYQVKNFKTEDCNNLYAFIMERSKYFLSADGFCGMIVPLSGHSTDRMKPLVKNFYKKFKSSYLFNISADANPSRLFPDVKFRLVIFVVSNNKEGNFSTKYKRWYSEERDYLFQSLYYDKCGEIEYKNVLPKISDSKHFSIINKLLNSNKKFTFDAGTFQTFYHNAPVNWIRSHSFVPYFKSERDGEKRSTQLKPLKFETLEKANSGTAVICSSLFFLWWLTVSDCYHLNKPELLNFPINFNDNKLVGCLNSIEAELKKDLISKSVRRIYNYKTSGKVEYDEFYLKRSKPIIDEIDKVLAEHYGFTEEELDFIINYDIKYRMGKELEG